MRHFTNLEFNPDAGISPADYELSDEEEEEWLCEDSDPEVDDEEA
jgi:hypothetical protein